MGSWETGHEGMDEKPATGFPVCVHVCVRERREKKGIESPLGTRCWPAAEVTD